MYNAQYDWGTVENQKVDLKQLAEMKRGASRIAFPR